MWCAFCTTGVRERPSVIQCGYHGLELSIAMIAGEGIWERERCGSASQKKLLTAEGALRPEMRCHSSPNPIWQLFRRFLTKIRMQDLVA